MPVQPQIIPNLSVDCVVFGFDFETKVLNVLLTRRYLESDTNHEILIDDYVLTGYHVLENEDIDQTATRVLKELTGLDNLYKKQFKVFGNPNRLMNEKDRIWAQKENFNERTITIAYYFLLQASEVSLNDTKRKAHWFPVNDLPEMGFDHLDIITDAYNDIKVKVLTEQIMFDLMPVKFTLNELQSAYEIILNVTLDNRNFRKKVLTKPYIVPLQDKKKVGTAKKPSQLYMFSNDVYFKLTEKDAIISTII